MTDNYSIKDALKGADNYQDVLRICRSVDNITTLQGAEIRKLLRALRKHQTAAIESGHVAPFRIAYLGNITFEPLPDHVCVAAACQGVTTQAYIGGYAQHMQELISDQSPLAEFNAHAIVIHLLLRELVPDVALRFSSLGTQQLNQARDTILDSVCQSVQMALNKHSATVIVVNFPAPAHDHYGVADQKRECSSEAEFYSVLNSRLRQRFIEEPRVHILDMERLTSLHGKKEAYDQKLYYLAKVPWQESFYPTIAEQLTRHIAAIQGTAKKCLVVDLDNTLWGGVLGEAGIQGIKVGHGDGESEAFFDFQNRILAIKDRGVLLAVCSKNNIEDVEEAFQQRTDMPLKLSDFSAMAINWEMKHTNLQRIAEKLNIGLDALTFIDDNPAECELIQQMLPQVSTVLLPKDPSCYPALIDSLHGFDKTAIAAEDQAKSRQYADNASRSEHQTQFDDLESYLESLQTEVTIWPAGEAEKQRVHQLFSKTNQFNLTTKRYSLAEIDAFIEQDRYALYVVKAVDRFGDLGIIGLCLIDQQDVSNVLIDSFILSCRAIGRGVESALMNFIKRRCFEQQGRRSLSGFFVPTKKNRPTEKFYNDQGFSISSDEHAGDGQHYILQAADSTMKDCHWINVTEQEEL